MKTLLWDNILVESIKKCGVVLTPKDTKKEVGIGMVIAVGPGQAYGLPAFQPITVKVGEKIHYVMESSVKVTIEGKEYRVVRERDCLLSEGIKENDEDNSPNKD